MAERTLSTGQAESLQKLAELWPSYWKHEQDENFEHFDVNIIRQFEEYFVIAIATGCTHYQVFNKILEATSQEDKQAVFKFLAINSSHRVQTTEENWYTACALMRIQYEQHLENPFAKKKK